MRNLSQQQIQIRTHNNYSFSCQNWTTTDIKMTGLIQFTPTTKQKLPILNQ